MNSPEDVSNKTRKRLLILKELLAWYAFRQWELSRDAPNRVFFAEQVDAVRWAVRELTSVYGEVELPPDHPTLQRIARLKARKK